MQLMNMLLIEDDTYFADVIAQLLVKEGCNVEVINSMSAAKKLAGRLNRFDLVLLDIWLDGESSLGLIDVIHSEAPAVPVVMMSGGGGPLSLDVATSMGIMKGVNGLLQKPIRRARLQKILNQFRE
jgi:DNA-binding NtrC family response regulator